MSWPLADAYVKMLQNPKVAFQDAELKGCTIKLDGNGQPAPMSGAFAVVFQAKLPDGSKRAVRAFTSDRPQITERYRLISEHLTTAASKVSALVSFGYNEKGVCAIVGGKARMYPLVTMDWVPGVTLYEWTAARCSAGETTRLRHATDAWPKLINDLAIAQIAHGDLQHGNILVDDRDQFKLVDYDCICVPALVGKKNLEIGVVPYQHQERDENTTLSLALDNFSAIFIYVALRALAAEPRLWNDFVVKSSYEKLLFREEDFLNGSSSGLYDRLQRSPDGDLARLANQLRDLYRGQIDAVPPLKDLLFSYDKIRGLLTARQFEEAVKLLQRKKDTSDSPNDLKPAIANAFQRTDRLAELRRKIQAGDERGMLQLYDPALFDDWPASQAEVAVARLAKQVIPLLDKIEQQRQQKMWRAFVHTWDSNRDLLQTRKSAQKFRADADTWRPKNQVCETVIRLVNQADCDPDQLQQAWDRLRSIGGHPEIDGHAAQVNRTVTRGRAWKPWRTTLQQATQGAGREQLDNQLVGSWNESLFAGWEIAERERAHLAAAHQRLKQLAELQRLVRQAPSQPTIQSERAIVQAEAQIPKGYDFAQRSRVETAERRLELVDQITAAVHRRDDLALAEYWKSLSALQGQSLVDSSLQDLARRSEQRSIAWENFRPALDRANAASSEQSDTELAQQWNESLFRGWSLAEQHRSRLDEANRCLAVVGRMDQLTRQMATVTLASEQEMVSVAAQLPPGYGHRHQQRADVAQQRLGAVQRLQQLVSASAEDEQILDAWHAVERLQATTLVDQATADRGSRSENRLQLWSQVEAVLGRLRAAAGEKDESELLRLWDNALFNGWRRAEAQRSQLTFAQQHRDVLHELSKAASAPLALPGENQIVSLVARLPQNYEYALRQRVEAARQRINAHNRLSDSVRHGTSEGAIVAAADELVRLQADSLLDLAVQRRVQIARQRVPILQMLAGIDGTLPLDQYDEQIRRLWRDDLLRDCPEARKWHDLFKVACHRQKLMQRLASAIAGKNEPLIAEIAADPSLAHYPLPDEWVKLVEEVKRATQGAHRLLDALKNNRRGEFLQYFDVDMIRRCQYLFVGVRQELAKWTREEILPLERLGLEQSQGRDSVVHLNGQMYRLRWQWPLSRYVKDCVVGVATQKPADHTDPRNDRAVSHVQTFGLSSRNDWCSFFYDRKRRATVYVWAVVDLGFEALTSPPLALGHIGVPVVANREISW